MTGGSLFQAGNKTNRMRIKVLLIPVVEMFVVAAQTLLLKILWVEA
jgi:hypothetical protein